MLPLLLSPGPFVAGPNLYFVRNGVRRGEENTAGRNQGQGRFIPPSIFLLSAMASQTTRYQK